MRLLVDENLQIPTIELLRKLGHDVVSVYDEDLESREDELIFERARQTNRALLTYNTDFADVRSLADIHHSGVIRLRLVNQRLTVAHAILQLAIAKLQDHDLTDSLVTVSEGRIRIRHTFVE